MVEELILAAIRGTTVTYEMCLLFLPYMSAPFLERLKVSPRKKKDKKKGVEGEHVEGVLPL